jgi:hypothetical protein
MRDIDVLKPVMLKKATIDLPSSGHAKPAGKTPCNIWKDVQERVLAR